MPRDEIDNGNDVDGVKVLKLLLVVHKFGLEDVDVHVELTPEVKSYELLGLDDHQFEMKLDSALVNVLAPISAVGELELELGTIVGLTPQKESTSPFCVESEVPCIFIPKLDNVVVDV